MKKRIEAYAAGFIAVCLLTLLAGEPFFRNEARADSGEAVYSIISAGAVYLLLQGHKRSVAKDITEVIRPWEHLNESQNLNMPLRLKPESMDRLKAATNFLAVGGDQSFWWQGQAQSPGNVDLKFENPVSTQLPPSADMVSLRYRENPQKIIIDAEFAADIITQSKIGQTSYAYWGIIGEAPQNKDVISNAFAVVYAPGLRIINEPGCYVIVTKSEKKISAQRINAGVDCKTDGRKLEFTMDKSALPGDLGGDRRFLFMTGEINNSLKPVQNLLEIVGAQRIKRGL